MGLIDLIRAVRNWKQYALVGLLLLALVGVCISSFRLQGPALVIIVAAGGIAMIGASARIAWSASVAKQVKIKILEEKQGPIVEERNLWRRKAEYLEQQLDEERKRQVKVLNIQPMFEVAVLKADCEISKCFDQYFDSSGKPLSSEESGEVKENQAGERKFRFVGTLTARFAAKYGVDMQKIRLKKDKITRTVYVTGIAPQYQGSDRFPAMNWQGCVALGRAVWSEWATDADGASELEARCKEEFRKQMEQDLANGPEQMEWVKEPLQKTVMHVLQMIVAPPEYRLEAVALDDESFCSFLDYVRNLGLDEPPSPQQLGPSGGNDEPPATAPVS